jgi:hypothetical protein
MMKMTAGKHLAKRLLSDGHTMHVSKGWEAGASKDKQTAG